MDKSQKDLETDFPLSPGVLALQEDSPEDAPPHPAPPPFILLCISQGMQGR